MTEIISAAGIVLDYAVSGVGDVATTVTSTPLLLCSAVISFGMICVGLFKRLLSTNI